MSQHVRWEQLACQVILREKPEEWELGENLERRWRMNMAGFCQNDCHIAEPPAPCHGFLITKFKWSFGNTIKMWIRKLMGAGKHCEKHQGRLTQFTITRHILQASQNSREIYSCWVTVSPWMTSCCCMTEYRVRICLCALPDVRLVYLQSWENSTLLSLKDFKKTRSTIITDI